MTPQLIATIHPIRNYNSDSVANAETQIKEAGSEAARHEVSEPSRKRKPEQEIIKEEVETQWIESSWRPVVPDTLSKDLGDLLRQEDELEVANDSSDEQRAEGDRDKLVVH